MGFKPLSMCTTSVETLKHAWQDKQCWQSPIIRTGQGIVEDEDTHGSCSRAARYEAEFVLTMGLHGWHGRTGVDCGVSEKYYNIQIPSRLLSDNRPSLFIHPRQYVQLITSWPMPSQSSVEYAQRASKASGSWSLKSQARRSWPLADNSPLETSHQSVMPPS
jgi:hypothetical protein